MIKKVRVSKYKEIIVEAECTFDEKSEYWVPDEIEHLADLLNDFGDDYDIDWEVIR